MKVRHTMPTTAGESTTGRIATMRNRPWPRRMAMTSRASARPIATCRTTVEPV
jgi:hypothetical protein